jgi:prolyl-tRNA synthetase
VVARRVRGAKETIALGALPERVPRILDEAQHELLAQATALRDRRTTRADTLEQARDLAGDGFARIAWRACGDAGEDQLAKSGISVRCLVRPDGQPVGDVDDADVDALLARAY